MTSMMASQVPVWQRSVPAVLSPLLPAMPLSDNVLADMQAAYEYKVMHLEAAEGNVRAIVLVRVAIPTPNPNNDNNNNNNNNNVNVPSAPNTVSLSSQQKEIRPMLFAHDLRSRSNVQWTQSNAANPVLRFQDDVGYMLHDRRYRCEGSPTCLASMRIRAWAHVSEIPVRDASKAPRTCAHCGRKGHRKQSCCEAPGNCRLEIEWMHNHPVIPPAQNTSSSIPIPAAVDSCAPSPPGISIAVENGDHPGAANGGAKRTMSAMEAFGNTRTNYNYSTYQNYNNILASNKKSRPSSGASSVYPFAPSNMNVGPASCGGGNGCPCEGARVVRGRCAEKLRYAEAAIRDLTNTLSDLASMHDDLSKRTQITAGTICSIEQLTQQRDTLRTEVDELWAQRNALLGDIPNSSINNNHNVNVNSNKFVSAAPSPSPAQPPPSLRRLSTVQLSTPVPPQIQTGAATPKLPAPLPPPSNGAPCIPTPIAPRMMALGPQLEGHSERTPVSSRTLEAANAHPLVAGARGANEMNNVNINIQTKDGADLMNLNANLIKEVASEESPINVNVNANENDEDAHKIPTERAMMEDKEDMVGKVNQGEEKNKAANRVNDVPMSTPEVVPDVATFGFASAEPLECGDNTETEEK